VNQQSKALPKARLRSLFLALAAAAWCAGLVSAGGCRKDKPAQKAAPDESLPLQTFARQWATDLKLRGDALEGLHVRDDQVYGYTEDGRVIALARDSGAIQFSRPIKGGRTLLHPPVVLNEKVELRGDQGPTAAVPVVIPTATTLEVLDKTTGRFLRSVDLNFTVRSEAVGRGPILYMGGAYRGSSRAAAIDIRQPYVPVVWELMTPGGAVSAAPALQEDTVFFGGEDGSVYAVTTAGREPIWPTPGGVFRTGGPIVGDLASDEQNVYVASTDNKLYALNRNNGKIRWQYFGASSLRTGPSVTSDTVYQYVAGDGLVALDKATGEYNRKPRWAAKDARQFLAQDGSNAYVRMRDNRIAALDKKTGEVRFTSGRRDLAVFCTNVLKEDGMIYAATKRGRIIAIRPVLKPGSVGEVVMLGSGEGFASEVE
jgi:outer membrane protein assembly factor BamB